MSANINSIMYYGEKPWHGIGTELDHAATSAEAIKAANLDWEVKSFPMYVDLNDSNGEMDLKKTEVRGTVRMDTHDVLGVVGRLYSPIQNVEAFSFFDQVVGEGKAMYHVAGALGKGEIIWILAKVPGEMRILRTDDIVEKYLLLTNNHDGKSVLKMYFSPIRVVCQNTLVLANSELNKSQRDCVKIKHYPGLHEKVEAAKVVLGLVDRTFNELQAAYNKLASYPVNDEWLDIYVKALIPAKNEEDVNYKTVQIRDGILSRFESESNSLAGIKGTAWAAYNSVSEYSDHFSFVNPRDKSDKTARLASSWLGRGADLKKKAFDIAVQLTDESSAAEVMASVATTN